MRSSSVITQLIGTLLAATLLSATIASAAPARAQPDASAATVREQFVAAMQRVRRGLADAPDSAELRAFVIYDYLEAARLQRGLVSKPGDDLDHAIDAFLTQHGQEPVGRNLRHDWWMSLAMRGRWDWLLPRAADATDPAVLCEVLRGRLLAQDTDGVAERALALWTTAQPPPVDCSAVFDWLHHQGLLTAELAERRARSALLAGNTRLARDELADLPAQQAAPLLQWIRLLDDSRAELEALAHEPRRAVDADALVAGFTHLSRIDASAALALLPALLARPGMTSDASARLQRAAALGAAYEHNRAALAAMQGLSVEAIDDDVREWRVRAALWAGDFGVALTWIEQMPPELAAAPRWQYWHARAQEAASGPEAAAPGYGQIAGLRDYYGYLAADRLHRAYSLNVAPSPVDTVLQAALAARPGVQRAHALFDCGMTDEAMTEWAVALADADNVAKVQAAQLASSWGWYAQAITTLAQTGAWDDLRLRYPWPYGDEIEQASLLTHLPSGWIMALMRQESLFRIDSVSPADARGLMQLRAGTARAVARHWHLPIPSPDALFDPSTSVPLGAAYLRDMIDRNAGQLALGLAAYNAGPQAVARWLPDAPMDADVWIENIPYNETRGYVQHVLEHIVAYAWARETELPRLAALLPPVQARATTVSDPVLPTDAALSSPLAKR